MLESIFFALCVYVIVELLLLPVAVVRRRASGWRWARLALALALLYVVSMLLFTTLNPTIITQ